MNLYSRIEGRIAEPAFAWDLHRPFPSRPAPPQPDAKEHFMSLQKLDIAFWNYDRTRALADGTVKIDGVDASFHSSRIVTEIFEQMIRRRAYDVSELGLTYYLRTLDLEEAPFVAIPVFPNRCFRHSAIYINKTSGIKRPQDLAGKTVGE